FPEKLIKSSFLIFQISNLKFQIPNSKPHMLRVTLCPSCLRVYVTPPSSSAAADTQSNPASTHSPPHVPRHSPAPPPSPALPPSPLPPQATSPRSLPPPPPSPPPLPPYNTSSEKKNL